MKTDKELAVEFAIAYTSAWFSRDSATLKPLNGDTIKQLIHEAYAAIHSLPNDEK